MRPITVCKNCSLFLHVKGKQWQVFGFMEKGSLYLQPEEALYLMEMVSVYVGVPQEGCDGPP